MNKKTVIPWTLLAVISPLEKNVNVLTSQWVEKVHQNIPTLNENNDSWRTIRNEISVSISEFYNKYVQGRP